MNYTKLYGALTLVCLLVVLSVGLLWAEDPLRTQPSARTPNPLSAEKLAKLNEAGKADGFNHPFEATGKEFQIKDNPICPDLKIHSSEEVHIFIDAITDTVSFRFSPVANTKNTEATITIEGIAGFFSKFKTAGNSPKLFRHQDGFFQESFELDKDGKYEYIQDLKKGHHVYFMPRRGTVYIGYEAQDPPSFPTPPLPYTYITATRTYELAQNINDNIVIVCSNITLDGKSHSITDSDSGYGIYLNYTGVTITNCVVKDFTEGIYVCNTGNTIISNTVESSTHVGIFLVAGSNTVLSNTATSNQYGIVSAWSTYQQVSYNNINQNALGLDIESTASNSDFSYNNFVGNSSAIFFWYGSYANVHHNYVTEGTSTGVYFYSSTNNLVQQNVFDSNVIAVYSYNSSGNTVNENDIAANGYGFYLQSGSCIFYHNDVYSSITYNAYANASVEISYNSQGNWWGHYAAPGFVSGTDSNDATVVDSYPYLVPSGWDKGYDPGEEDTTGPSAPVLLSPEDGDAISDTTPSFTWESSVDTGTSVADYHIQIDTTSTFTSQENTKLLLHMNGTDGSTTFTDSSGNSHSVTAYGNAQIDTEYSKFGGASGLFDGSGDYLTSPDSDDWTFGNGNFTIDCWVRLSGLPSTHDMIYSQYVDGNNFIYVSLWNVSGTYYVRLAWNIAGGGDQAITRAITLATDTWFHLAIVRSGNDFYFFKDGTQLGTTETNAVTFPNLEAGVEIGAYSALCLYHYGHFDELRISKGIARWTSNFTPPTNQYGRSSIISEIGITPTGYTLTGALQDGLYYWRVRARDFLGNYGSFSSPITFTMDTVAPFTPTLSAPLNGQNKTDTTPAFSWSTTDTDIADYDLQVDRSSTFNSYGAKLLLHMNGTLSSTAFTDSSSFAHSVMSINGAQIDTAQSKFCGASGFFDGIDDYLSISDSDEFYLSNGNFTLDTWVMLDSLPASGSIVPLYRQFGNSTSNFGWDVYNNAGSYELRITWNMGSGSQSITKTITSGVNTGEWIHLATTRSGDNFYFFKDGSLLGSETNSVTFNNIAGTPSIGHRGGATPACLDGHMDEFRLIKGGAVWISDFTPSDTYEYAIPTASVTGITDTNYTLSTAYLTHGTHYWRVRARDNAGNYGPYADAYTFVITDTTPSISYVTPDHGVPGDVITITGSYFWSQQWNSKVYINDDGDDMEAEVASWSDDTIVITVPNMAPCAGLLYVQTDITHSDTVNFQVGWNETAGGDHSGQAWTPADDETACGTHYNITTFTVASGVTLTVPEYNGSTGGSLKVEADIAIISGTIMAAGKGYGSGQGPGTPTDSGSYGGNGASHANLGGHGYQGGSGLGPVYGDRYKPNTMGSGGAPGGGSSLGGAGGGLIEFWIGGTFTFNGIINLIGGSGTVSGDYGGGGGAGGSLLVVAHTVEGYGLTSARGGYGGAGATYQGGGGSGGYISFNCTIKNSSFANNQVIGGASGGGYAENGQDGYVGYTVQGIGKCCDCNCSCCGDGRADGKCDCPCNAIKAGSSANAASGNLNLDIDITRIAPINSLPCNITLYYNSGATDTADSLGPKWTHTFNHSVTTPTGATNILIWRDGSGKAITFNNDNPDVDNVYESASAYGAYAVITSTPGTGYTIRTKERLFYNFNLTGTLTSIQDMYANAVTCTYSSGLLSNIELSGGRKIYITSTGTSITSIEDPAGYVTSISYNGGQLYEVSKTEGGSTWKKRFTYQAGTNLIATKVDDPDGINNTTSYGYDFAGRLTTVTKYIEDDNKTLSITRDLYTGEATVEGFDGKDSAVGFDMILNKATQKTDELGNSIDYSFDITGNMTSQTNARGYPTLLEYDARGNVTSSTNAAGANTRYTYGDSANPDLPTLITDALGYKTYIGYNTYGKVTSTTNAAGVNIQFTYYTSGDATYPSWIGKLHTETIYGAGTAGGNIETHYTYDSYGYPDVKTVDNGGLNIAYDTGYNANGWLTSSKNPLNRETTYTYDYRGNNTDITDPYSKVTHKVFDKMERMTDLYKDYLGTDETQTKYTFNKQGWLTKTEVRTDGANYITTNLAYDYDGNLTQTTGPVTGDQTDYTYYDNGWLHTTTKKLNATQNAVTTKSYDANGNITDIEDPRGNHTHLTYDSADNVTKKEVDIETDIDATGHLTINITYDLMGRVVSSTDYAGNYTHIFYDELGRVKYKRTPEDNITVAYTYDKLSRTTRLTGPWKDANTNGLADDADSANIAMTDFDNAGRVISTSVNAHTSIEYDYDAAGNMTQKEDALGVITTFEYDNMDRLTITTFADGTADEYATKKFYDNLGRVNQVTNAYLDGTLDTNTYFYYDDAGRMTRERKFTNLADTYATTYEYNARGQMTKQTDANGKETTWDFDNGGRMTKEINAKGGNNYTRYAYDLSGNRTDTWYYKGTGEVNTHYTFYKNNLLHETVYPGYGDVSNTTHNLCDKNGNLIEQIDAKGNTTTFTYDDNNRLTGKTYQDASTVAYTLDARSNVLTVVDANTNTTNEYDDLSRLIAVTDTLLSKSIVYGYNEDGTRSYMDGPDSSDTVTYTYDNAKRLHTVVKGGTTLADYTYNDLSLRTREDLGNSSYITYTYHATTRWLTGVYNNTSTSTLISSFEYDYTGDNVGNKKKMTMLGGDYVDYTYDDIYQLTNEVRTGTTAYQRVWTYDEVGNRLTQTLDATTTTNYTYNDANQLTDETITGVSTITYTYDANGNMITKTNGSSVYWNYYDYENHIVSYYDAISTNNYTQTFDAYGRMIFMDTSTTDRRRFYDGMNCIADYDTSGSPVAQYVTPFLDDNLVMSRSSGTYYYFHDGLGSVRNIYTSGEIWNNTYDYTAFGEPLNWTENVSIHNRFTFTGREWNGKSQRYGYRTRELDPYTGTFNRRDSIGYTGGINLYSYVNNNPINYADPYGQFKIDGVELPDDLWISFSKDADDMTDQELQEAIGQLSSEINQYSTYYCNGCNRRNSIDKRLNELIDESNRREIEAVTKSRARAIASAEAKGVKGSLPKLHERKYEDFVKPPSLPEPEQIATRRSPDYGKIGTGAVFIVGGSFQLGLGLFLYGTAAAEALGGPPGWLAALHTLTPATAMTGSGIAGIGGGFYFIIEGIIGE